MDGGMVPTVEADATQKDRRKGIGINSGKQLE
jgi:uncharacterized protein YigE (DUF2233 family)